MEEFAAWAIVEKAVSVVDESVEATYRPIAIYSERNGDTEEKVREKMVWLLKPVHERNVEEHRDLSFVVGAPNPTVHRSYTLHESKITKLGDGTSRIDFGPEIPV
jgi:hypothetical protein